MVNSLLLSSEYFLFVLNCFQNLQKVDNFILETLTTEPVGQLYYAQYLRMTAFNEVLRFLFHLENPEGICF